MGQNVTVDSVTFPGCTLYAIVSSQDETISLMLQQEWDYIILQDYSILPTVKAAQDMYFNPAIERFREKKNKAKLVMYQTWGFHSGYTDTCPNSYTDYCFPLESLASLTSPPCYSNDTYTRELSSFECMGYALAQGYGSVRHKVDMIAPCGLAWQVVRGSSSIPSECKALIDAENGSPFPVTLPFEVDGGQLPDLMLYKNYSGYIDKHPNMAGQYLNALTMYAILFQRSPIGAAGPASVSSESGDLNRQLTADEILALQTAAEGAVEQCGQACQGTFISHSILGECSDYGCQPIPDADTCRSLLQSESFCTSNLGFLEGDWDFYPDGCYFKVEDSLCVWNARNTTLSGNSLRPKICACGSSTESSSTSSNQGDDSRR